jgi:hypothetical protein
MIVLTMVFILQLRDSFAIYTYPEEFVTERVSLDKNINKMVLSNRVFVLHRGLLKFIILYLGRF